MGLNLCPGAWNKLTAIMGAPIGRTQTKKVTVKGKAKCPKCGLEFDVEFEVEQKVAGAISDFKMAPLSGLSTMCPWSMSLKE